MPDIRETIKRNVIAAVGAITGDPAIQRKDAQTWLINAGMKTGNAQRLLAADSDYGITRLEEAAKMLGTTPAALVSPGAAPMVSAAGPEVLVMAQLARLPESPGKKALILQVLQQIAELMAEAPARPASPPQPQAMPQHSEGLPARHDTRHEQP